MTARSSWLFSVLALGALVVAACGERRSGGGIVVRRDGGSGRPDATMNDRDTGMPPIDTGVVVPDSGSDRDSGGRDSGGRDSGGDPDSGDEPDSGVVAPIDVTIRALQDESNASHPVPDTVVRLVGVIVTAVQSTGTAAGSFWVQENPGGPYSGILIFVPPEKVGIYTVTPGESLVLSGVYKEYFDVSEVVLDTIETQTPGFELPAPIDMSPSEIATGGALGEAMEGVLVRVSNVMVLSENPDAPMDFGEFTVSGELRVDDQLYRLTPRPLAGTILPYIVGVHHHAFANYKLLPRSELDIGF